MNLPLLRVPFTLSLLFLGCSGPNSPLGATSSLFPESQTPPYTPSQGESDTQPLSASIQFYPERQVLHDTASFELAVTDYLEPIQRKHVHVLYNGLDVSEKFLRSSVPVSGIAQNQIRVSIPRMYLNPYESHKIEVFYQNQSGFVIHRKYKPPTCKAFRTVEILNTGKFNPSAQLLDTIREQAEDRGVSPVFLTALIAQESAFDEKAVSWARAIGLTQITPIAEKEIIQEYPEWPRYDGINDMPLAWLKLQIQRGKINAQNEWRLNTERSILGGLTHAQNIAEKWSTRERLDQIKSRFENPEIEHTRLILASYHSGYYRVYRSFLRNKENWLNSVQLREAKKYINRVFSYCYHFSQSQV